MTLLAVEAPFLFDSQLHGDSAWSLACCPVAATLVSADNPTVSASSASCRPICPAPLRQGVCISVFVSLSVSVWIPCD